MMSFKNKLKKLFIILELLLLNMIYVLKYILKIFSSYHIIKVSAIVKNHMKSRLLQLDTVFQYF